MKKLAGGRQLGRLFASSRDRLRQAAQQLRVHHLANLDGCAAGSGLKTNASRLAHFAKTTSNSPNSDRERFFL